MSFYSGLTATAAKLLLKYGQSVVLKHETGGTVNPATGVVTTSATVTTITGNGAASRYKNAEVDGTLIRSGDQRLILEKVSTVPQTGWKAQVSGKEYKVMGAVPISPGNEDVIYICQLRLN